MTKRELALEIINELEELGLIVVTDHPKKPVVSRDQQHDPACTADSGRSSAAPKARPH